VVLNTTSKTVTSQFLVCFNDSFSTGPNNGQIDPLAWHSLITTPLCDSSTFDNVRLRTPLDPASNPELPDKWHEPDEKLLRDQQRRHTAALRHAPPSSVSSLPQPVVPLSQRESNLQQRELPPSTKQVGL
jgi:hypothetical protein